MVTNILNAIQNTINFLQTSTGIFILILIAIVAVESLVIWLLIWIIKNQFDKNKGEKNNGTITN
jgi:nitrogen fixation-related uncharacterized protein